MKIEVCNNGDDVRIKMVCESSADFRAKDSIENSIENKDGKVTIQLIGRTLSNQNLFVLRRA